VSDVERLTSTELAQAAAAAADAKGAQDVVILDVADILGICDLFVIASARNVRQVAAVTEEIEERLWLGHDVKPNSVEGMDARRWVLVDYGDVVIHVFLEEERAYYRLERLYGDATQIEWIPDGDGVRSAGRPDSA
jgi:ribosome-associated protein